jgi:hypothetical protein
MHVERRTTLLPRALILLPLAGVASSGSAQTGGAPAVDTIVARMMQARHENRAYLRPYTLTRDYKIFGEEKNTAKTEVTAAVTFLPPRLKQYAIQQQNGKWLGVTVVRRVLESEVEIAKDYSTTDIAPQNYEFRFAGEETHGGRRCYVVEMLPRRKDKSLLRGRIWIDADTYLPLRSEGQPGKSPSWWLRDVHMTFVYGDVSGMWLQVASEITGDVRTLGRHTMVSRDASYKVGDLDARPAVASEAFSHLFEVPGRK